MITFYRSGELHITDEWVRVRDAYYPTAELDEVWTAPPFPMAGLVRRIALLVGGGLASAVGAFGLYLFLNGGLREAGVTGVREFFTSYLALVLLIVGLVVLGRSLDPTRGPEHLWMTCAGQDIKVTVALDAVELGKARRALVRARDHARPDLRG